MNLFILPKDIENMTTQEFGRTLKYGIIRNFIDLENKIITIIEEKKRKIF